MNNKVKINQGRVVPVQFRVFGSVVVLIAMTYSLTHFSEIPAILISIAISFLIPLLWSSFYILQIDPQSKEISEGYWVMNIKKMDTQHYEEIEKIFVNEVNTSQQITSYGGKVANLKRKEYAAYLKLTTGEKFYLLGDSTEEGVLKKLEPIKKKLGLE
ncbi:MAG: hypothetical protein RIC35_22335 [Marinoscillum sp.]